MRLAALRKKSSVCVWDVVTAIPALAV
jgi:hypothetical protein